MNEFMEFSFPKWTNIITVVDNGMFKIGPYEYQVKMVSNKWPTADDVQDALKQVTDTETTYAIITDDEFEYGKTVTVINGEARFISLDAYLNYYDLSMEDVLNVARANHHLSAI